METHNQRFRRLASARLSRIFQTMSLIANLSGSQYAYTQADADEMFTTYQKLGNAARAYFTGPTRWNEMPSTFAFKNQEAVSADEQEAHSRFRRLAENRMSRVLRDLRLVVNLSDRSNYTFTENEVAQMFDAYESLGKAVAARFVHLPQEFHFTPNR